MTIEVSIVFINAARKYKFDHRTAPLTCCMKRSHLSVSSWSRPCGSFSGAIAVLSFFKAQKRRPVGFSWLDDKYALLFQLFWSELV